MTRRRAALAAFIYFAFGVAGGNVLGQPAPNKVARLMVGHGPGGQADTVARVLAPKLAELWGRPVVIENRVGAAGIISANHVAKSPPDGLTLLVATSTNLAIAAVIVRTPPYDPTNDLAMITRIVSIPTVLAVASRLPVQSVAQVVDYAKSRPAQLAGASSGIGSSSGFTLEMFKTAADIDILQVPYNGLGPAVMGLLSGQVDVIFADHSLLKPHVKSGAVRLLAAVGSRRLAVAPELPTMRELGFDVTIDSTLGVAAPAGTPPETIERLARDIRLVLRSPDVRRQLVDGGFDPIEDTPAQFAIVLRQDIEKFGVVARRLGLDATN
jgi:tripartite-type tricarboxylate transporter receptor subunit TctC